MDVPRLRRSLLGWFRRTKRPLPWRMTRDPYAIWVSEVMLQQTTVGAVIPFYQRFIARFPTIKALATAELDDVLAAWSGLGYYSRAKNLRLAAQRLVSHHRAAFPSDVATAISLPGVGAYTASAVTSIAFGTRAAAVDGNVRRVLARLFAVQLPSASRTQDLADSLLSSRSPGAWNEAMMELGATVCTPRAPRCAQCPVRADCGGRTRAEHWSKLKPRRATIRTRVDMALVESNDAVLLTCTPMGQPMAGMYELPHTGLPVPDSPGAGAWARCLSALRLETTPAFTMRHTVTHHRIEARVFRGQMRRRATPPATAFHAIKALADLPLGGLTRKALHAAGKLESRSGHWG